MTWVWVPFYWGGLIGLALALGSGYISLKEYWACSCWLYSMTGLLQAMGHNRFGAIMSWCYAAVWYWFWKISKDDDGPGKKRKALAKKIPRPKLVKVRQVAPT